MAKVRPISGFPEWLPEQRIVEQQLVDEIRRRFESYGFAPIETRAVEPLEQLLAKGETSQEIYVLRRLQAAEGEPDSGLGLHFDLTVPFARYVAQHRGQLAFPFKRYQIQKAWRGERPQTGRYREFLQADLDVIDQGELSLHFDAEMPRLVQETLSALPVPAVVVGLNNRKLLEGFYRGLGIEDVAPVLRTVDKLDKAGPERVREMLVADVGLTEDVAAQCLALGRIRTNDASFAAAVRELGVAHELLERGVEELAFVMDALSDLPAGSVAADLSIARGLDYYTGTVYEARFAEDVGVGTVAAGGRYDDLCGDEKVQLPGVGISVGASRLLAPLLAKGALRASRSVPTCVLVVLPAEERRDAARAVARALRARGIPAETYHEPVRYGKQLKYAQKRDIPFVWFPPDDDGEEHEVKDLRSGDQTTANADAWTPPDADVYPQIRD